MAKVLAVYSKASGLQAASLAIIINKYPDADILDISGLTVAAQLNAVQALTDGTYDQVFFLCPISDTGTTLTTPSFDFYGNLFPKMKTSVATNTLVTSGVVQTGTSDTDQATLATADAQANDYYNNMIFVITSGTHLTSSTPAADDIYKRILDYVGTSTNTIQVGGEAVTGSYDNTDNYKIYDMTGYIIELNGTETSIGILGTTAVDTKSTLLNTWESLYPSVDRPMFVGLASCHKYAIEAGLISDATGAASGVYILDLTPDGSSSATAADLAVNDALNGMYLCLTGVTGLGQFRKITDYVGSTRTVTLENAFVVAADNTTNYRVVDRLEYALADVAIQEMSKVIFRNVGNTTANVAADNALALQAIIKLIDNEGVLQQNGVATSDWKYLFDTFVAQGRRMFQHTNVANL